MLHRRAFLPMVTLVSLLLSLPGLVRGGSLYLEAHPCWCDGVTSPQAWNFFNVVYAPSEPRECQLASVAFRLQGVPNDPALMRRFDPYAFTGEMTGDPFAEGVTIRGLVPLPGDTPVGTIALYVTTPLAAQVWSVEAHQGIIGSTTPVAEFESAVGTWEAQTGHSTMIGNASPQCEACVQLHLVQCPFAVEPGTWSMVKILYQ